MTTQVAFSLHDRVQWRRVSLIVLGFMALWASANWRIPLEPVPVSMQLFMALLFGFLLDWRAALVCVGSYAAAAFLAGPPIAAGHPALTGGYLFGFVLAAVLVANVWPHAKSHAWPERFGAALMLALAGALIVYVLGTAWLHIALVIAKPDETIGMTLASSVTPFIGYDLLKCVAVALLASAHGPRS